MPYKDWYRKNREKALKYQKEWQRRDRKKNPERYRFVRLKSVYGISKIEFEKLLEFQNNRCALPFCNKLLIGRDVCVDHDHETGEVRGLLCQKCNRALGFFKNVDALGQAAYYLKNPPYRLSL